MPSRFARLLPLHSARNVEDNITPTIYDDDLYAVLGVNPSASKKELQKAYWAIAFANHPDRNDSIDALYKFRNASYAYKVLGRDVRSRADYDAVYKTKRYIKAMDRAIDDVILPWASVVAAPIINKTISAAVPFLRDAYHLSSAAIKAALNGDIDTGLDVNVLYRMMNRRERNVLYLQIKKTNEIIQRTRADVLVSCQKLSEVNSQIENLERNLKDVENRYSQKDFDEKAR
jgi:curved DNA-binding protein CbpA